MEAAMGDKGAGISRLIGDKRNGKRGCTYLSERDAICSCALNGFPQ